MFHITVDSGGIFGLKCSKIGAEYKIMMKNRNIHVLNFF